MIGKALADLLEAINPVILNNIKQSQEIITKADDSIVTRTDRQVEKRLSTQLQQIIPHSYIVGEKSAPADPETVAKIFENEYIWAVDPIDGTVNFSTGLPLFAVSIGLLKRGKNGHSIVAGAISLPMFSQIYFTKGNKTFLRNTLSNEETEVVRTPNTQVPVLLVSSSFHQKYQVDGKNRLTRNIRQLGCTAANLLYVAIGKATGTYTAAHLWDFAGSFAIAKTFGLLPRELSTGKCKTHYRIEDFLYGHPKKDWRIREPLILCEEKYSPDIQQLFIS